MGRKLRFVFLVAASLAVGIAIGALGDDPTIKSDMVAVAEAIIGVEFSPAERDSMVDDLNFYAESYAKLRSIEISNDVPPALVFNPVPVGAHYDGPSRMAVGEVRLDGVPDDFDDLAFYSVRDLAELIRTRRVTSVQLTELYLKRLKEHGKLLECVVTLTEDRAIAQAQKADREIAAGRYRGTLHGIPYGAKDLFAVSGYPTTWGAEPFKEQVFDETATVIRKLDTAGAVLVAKLTMGALAWGDVWFGGMTRNPWDLEQGSSGSSAGPASATSAGLVAFAIGTETWGSIVSPSTRCGTTGLRPTYGRVSRTGAMALSWSMDKIGPICRTVEDCAIVFDAIRGADGQDQTLVDAPFYYDASTPLAEIKIGYVKEMFEEDYPNKERDNATLETLRGLGVTLLPVTLPDFPVDALSFILTAESAAAFDELTRSNRDDLLVRQIKKAWPNVFRAARFIPAVEYIQANRARYLLMQEMESMAVDVYITPSFGGDNLLLTNLTGHPCVVLPNGFDDEGHPTSITFMGRLFGEGAALTVAKAYQDVTDFHLQHPPAFQ